MVRVSGRNDLSPLEYIELYDSHGLNVFPAKYRDKPPIVKWQQHQASGVTRKTMENWFSGSNKLNFWIMTGNASKLIVIDADSPEGDAWWRSRLGDSLLDNTAIVQSRKGKHYYFRIPADWDKTVPSWSVHPGPGDEFLESFDFSAEGRGVIAPPSVHESGFHYEWLRPLEHLTEAPIELLDGRFRDEAPGARENATGGGGTDWRGEPRSLLARLLASPPAEGGRNDWMARVAGHYAKMHHDQHDLYVAQCEAQNHRLGPPLSQEELTKTLDSIWKSEHENNPQRALSEKTGWLKGNGKSLFTQVQEKHGESVDYGIAPWANFDITATGVTRGIDQAQTYLVVLRTEDGDLELQLPGALLGDDRALKKWLASFGAIVTQPGNTFPRDGWTPGTRLQHYIKAQKPPAVHLSEALGWDPEALDGEGAFVTHDGIILAEGSIPSEKCGIRAASILLTSGVAPHQYGFQGSEHDAMMVLDEVLSFHDPVVTSVFGAWWAACWLKPQLHALASMFPFMGIQAPSESGKTSGFFGMMIQLNGNTSGEQVPTYAALRNMVAGHSNGMVWVDDMDDPNKMMELLRAATGNGIITKMGEDRTTTSKQKMRAPVVLSGEHLGLASQKALADRSVAISVGSPTSRMSRHDPARIQWLDIVDLKKQYPKGLSVLAGWYAMKSLQVEAEVCDVYVQARKRGGGGRVADKAAILLAGACLLDHLCGHEDPWGQQGEHAMRVSDWLDGTAKHVLAADNALTMEVAPWALRAHNFPSKPEFDEHKGYNTPVFVEGDPEELGGFKVWISAADLADAWKRHNPRAELRTASKDALNEQLNVISPGNKYRKQKRITNTNRPYYKYIEGEYALAVFNRAQGTS